MENKTDDAGQHFQLESISRDDCKYCYGRGYERWLSARIKHPDGSKEEQFEDRQCRCVRIKMVKSLESHAHAKA